MAGIGRILDTLAETGPSRAEHHRGVHQRQTVQRFFNPPYMLEPGETDLQTSASTAGLRGSKGWILRRRHSRSDGACGGPGHVPGGRYADELTHFTDWMPTLLSLAGVEAAVRPRRSMAAT